MFDSPAYERLRRAAEESLDRFVPPASARPVRLHSAMRHSLEAGGKRLRPVLLAATAEAFARQPLPFSPGEAFSQAGALASPWPAATAVECIHTYSLIHDDLPAMDDSDLRRGRPSCHRQYDEATAILAGDALQPLAFSILAHSYADRPPLASALVADLAEAAGSRALVGGQMEDILAEGRPASADELRYIHLNKTAALLTACIVMGARVGGAPAEALPRAAAAGEHLGLAFQIVDDLLDATSDSATLGKSAGADAALGKNTYVKLHGIDSARGEARHHTRSAMEALRSLPADTSFLVALAASLEHRIR